MFIRIGDEKRELIDAHLTVLSNKFTELLNKQDAEMLADVTLMFRQVIENMPHKVLLYASLIGLMASQDRAKVSILISEVLNSSLTE